MLPDQPAKTDKGLVRQTLLAEQEQAVDAGLIKMEEGYIEVGRALTVIRDQRLYKKHAKRWDVYTASIYAPGQSYAGKLWSMDASTANRAIAALRTAEEVSSGNGVMPKVESVARAVRTVSKDPNVRRAVWELAVNSHPSHTPTTSWVNAAKNVLDMTSDTQGFVPTFGGEGMVKATPAAMIAATVAYADENVKRAATHAHEAQLKKTGGMRRENVVTNVYCKLVRVNAITGLVTFRMASNNAMYVRDGIHDAQADDFFLTVNHLIDSGVDPNEQSNPSIE